VLQHSAAACGTVTTEFMLGNMRFIVRV